MAATPGALQLRLLQTVVDVAAEKNSTLVMPFPVELLRFFDHAAQPETAHATEFLLGRQADHDLQPETVTNGDGEMLIPAP